MTRIAVSILTTSTLLGLAMVPAATAQDTRAFELRTYIAEEGKLEALHRRFRDHTIGLFKKHGMEVIGFWTPVAATSAPAAGTPAAAPTSADADAANTLVYLMAYPSQEARDASWKAFAADPEWKAVYAESHRDGPLVKKVESRKLDPTDYSPMK